MKKAVVIGLLLTVAGFGKPHPKFKAAGHRVVSAVKTTGTIIGVTIICAGLVYVMAGRPN
jgi:hypothetical protein